MARRRGADTLIRYRGADVVPKRYRGPDVVWDHAGAGPAIRSFGVTPNTLLRSAFSTTPHVQVQWDVDIPTGTAASIGITQTLADGTTTTHAVSGESGTDDFTRPDQSATYRITVTDDQNQISTASALFEVRAYPAIEYFRARRDAEGHDLFSEEAVPGVGVIGTITLEWKSTAEPWGYTSLSGAGSSSFDSSRSHNDHTNRATRIGSLRLSHALDSEVQRVTYTLRRWNSTNRRAARTFTFAWPQGGAA